MRGYRSQTPHLDSVEAGDAPQSPQTLQREAAVDEVIACGHLTMSPSTIPSTPQAPERTPAFAQQEASDAPPADYRFARPDIAEL
ncbi:MAG: hypothetical protein ABI427_20330, partial [Solirubrobacteraceae bacterium]